METLGYIIVIAGWLIWVVSMILPWFKYNGGSFFPVPAFGILCLTSPLEDIYYLGDLIGFGVENMFWMLFKIFGTLAVLLSSIMIPLGLVSSIFVSTFSLFNIASYWFAGLAVVGIIAWIIFHWRDETIRHFALTGFYLFPLSYVVIAIGFFLI